MKKSGKGGEALFKDIGDIKSESKNILKTPIDEEEEDGKYFKEPKGRVVESTPLSTKRKKGSTRNNRKSKRIRSSDESNMSVDLFSGNESISLKDIEDIERSHIDVPSKDLYLVKTINSLSDQIGGESENLSLTASMINEPLSGEIIGKQKVNENIDNQIDDQEQLSPCMTSSILNQRLSNESISENDENPCNSKTPYKVDKDSDETLIKLVDPSVNNTPCGDDLDKCISTFYESALLDENCSKTPCVTKLFNDSEFTKNESALVNMELTSVESLYNSYPQNTFYGLSLNVKEILIQTRGISKLYGEFSLN